MDDLKHKVLGFINKQGINAKIPSMGFSDPYAFENNAESQIVSVNSKSVATENRADDQAILESIEAVYFQNDDEFDARRHELRKLPEHLECSSIMNDFTKLKQQHQVVSNKVLQLILQKQSACNAEFSNVLEIQSQLDETLTVCQKGRGNLALAKRQFTTASLGILANYRKRQLVQGLLLSLNTIKSLQNTESKLPELLAGGNYSEAISLLLECQEEASHYKHFACVAALSGKFQDSLVMAEEQLDVALSKICYMFDVSTYSKIQAAYSLLGKTQMAVDQLHMHFTSAIHSTAFSVVHGYAERPETPKQGQKRQYKQLCQSVASDGFIQCLIDLCRSLWTILASYHKVMSWHLNRTDTKTDVNTDYIHKKLDSGQSRVWHDVQSKISVFLLSADLGCYKIEQFLQVLSIVHRLIEIGDEFCGSKSEELNDLIKKHSINYFKTYHANRLEELRIFMENEGWELCPVKSSFNILQLQEFKPLRHVLKHFKNQQSTNFRNGSVDLHQQSSDFSSILNNDSCSSNHSEDGSSVSGHFFMRFSMRGTPFDSKLDDTIVEEDFYAIPDEASAYLSEDSEEDVDHPCSDEEKSTENSGDSSAQPALLTNTTLTVLRHCGRYLQMSRLLRSIALDIIICMSQLFDYYLYSVHAFFATDSRVSNSSLYTAVLNHTLKRIHDNLINDTSSNSNEAGCNKMNRDRVNKPEMSSLVDLSQSENLFGLSKRVVAVESLVFLGKQFIMLQPYLEYLVPKENHYLLHQFYAQSVNIAVDLRKPVYMCVAAQIFDLRQTLISISKVNWEVTDVMIQHSTYVDALLRDIQIFLMRLESLTAGFFMPMEVIKTLWENIAHLVTHTLVEGYSNVKKCSTGGRALMQLDFTQFWSKFEKLSSMKSLPHKEYVESYVKAYYLSEPGLEEFIVEHKEYSTKHLLGLVSCIHSNNKKARQKLTTLIEDLDRKKLEQNQT